MRQVVVGTSQNHPDHRLIHWFNVFFRMIAWGAALGGVVAAILIVGGIVNHSNKSEISLSVLGALAGAIAAVIADYWNRPPR